MKAMALHWRRPKRRAGVAARYNGSHQWFPALAGLGSPSKSLGFLLKYVKNVEISLKLY
jgi:hypothetical protein